MPGTVKATTLESGAFMSSVELATLLTFVSASVPAAARVSPEYVLLPARVSVPAPDLVSEPPLLMSGETNVTLCPLVSMV